MRWKAAPCENDMMPSKGPLAAANSVRAATASEKPSSQSDLSWASKLGAGRLNHQPRGSTCLWEGAEDEYIICRVVTVNLTGEISVTGEIYKFHRCHL